MIGVKASHLLVLLALTACALVATAGPANAAAKRETPCEHANLQPAQGNLATVRAAVLCLHNRERSARGLPRLTEHARLREAAAKHSAHMVADHFFAHDTPSGASMADRVLRTGYAANSAWTVGENIAWGTGELATAAEIQRSWMQSPAHKANVLKRDFREIGIGIALGAPVDAKRRDGATYTADFGVRR